VRRIFWANQALADFDQQIGQIAANSPKGAQLVAERLHKAIEGLTKTASGRLGRFPGTYEKFVTKTSHVIVYVKDDSAKTITILRIIHTSREWLIGTLPD